MKRVLIVSNEIGKDASGEIQESWMHELGESLKNIPNLYNVVSDAASNAKVEVIHHRELREKNATQYDRVILSGFFPGKSYSDEMLKEEFAEEIDFIREAEQPILGICLGIQLIGLAFGMGSKPLDCAGGEHGFVTLHREMEHFLLEDIPEHFQTIGMHGRELMDIPGNFNLLISGDACRVQGIVHKERPIYGVQFHPEIMSERNEASNILFHFLRE